MATGDQSDAFGRLRALLPTGWFGDLTLAPVASALLQGYAWAISQVYALYLYARLQTRIKTATDGWLDMIAADFFGNTLMRTQGQSDASFRSRIVANMFRERGTRKAIVAVLTDLTGRAPVIFEPTRPADTGSYGGPAIGYGVAGGYGSLLLPYQAFVTAYRPAGSGIPLVAGYGISTGAYRTPSRSEYASTAMEANQIQDADIFAAVDAVKPAGTVVWVQIKG